MNSESIVIVRVIMIFYDAFCCLNNAELKTLSLTQSHYGGQCWPDSQCVTDVTVYHAIAFMKHLMHLKIEGVKVCAIAMQ